MRKTRPDKLFTSLEKTGEDGVRKLLAFGRVYGKDSVELVRVWLDQKTQERASAVEREQMAIARDAAASARDAADSARDSSDSARAMAREARTANTMATIAIAIAIAGIIMSVIGLFFPWGGSSEG